MPATVILPEQRPIRVLHDGRWFDGWWLEAYGREPSGWRGVVPTRRTSYRLPHERPRTGTTSNT